MLESPRLRLLGKEELRRIRPIFRSNGSNADPTKQLLAAAIAELSDETIVGMLGFELIPHCGPLIVNENYRGQGLASKLYGVIEDQFTKVKGSGYYTFPSNDASRRVAEKLGLEKLKDWEVWKREY